MKAVRVHVFGGPEALVHEDVPVPEPGPGEALVQIAASGINFIDVQHRAGRYKLPGMPVTIGSEAAGTVSAVGAGVTEVTVGDRVAYAMVVGSYADYAVVPASRLVPLPAGVDFQSAAAVMLQGMTAHYLSHSTYPLKPGDTCIVHAGAGGVGLLLTQIAKLRGARVLTTVSTEEKAALSRAAGADEVVLYTKDDFEAAAKKMTGGAGVQVVYDSVGKTTFDTSLHSLAPRGMLVLFGQSSGLVPPIDPGILAKNGSLFLTRPTLVNYIASVEELRQRAKDVFGWIAAGTLKLRLEHDFPLKDAAAAHTALEGRKTTGKVLLIP